MSGSKSPPQIKDWTRDHVKEWLLSDVKVKPTYAERFFDEDVCGEYLVDFSKSEIIDLGIKHGPAVKITYHLKQWKEHSNAEPQHPAYVHNWSKEQVNQWLLQYVNLGRDYAQQLLNEEVSGDCLVCFEKQDFKDLNIKQGPSVRILKELLRLKDKPEPELQHATSTVTDEEADELCALPGPCASQPVVQASTQSQTQKKTTASADNQRLHSQSTPIFHQKPPNPVMDSKMKPSVEVLESSSESKIYDVLNDLLKNELKDFSFHLKGYQSMKYKQIPLSNLENATRAQIATLISQNYGNDAPQVTVDILRRMNKNTSASELEQAAGLQVSKGLKSKTIPPAESDQGEKLKNLLTCGGNTLDNYETFVVVLNKSQTDQVQHMQFLSKLKVFCVLDFDPNSACVGGVCHFYRDIRVANLHRPSQYQGQTELVVKNLNLRKQTSWVFCNGRNDLEDTSHEELDYKTWLKKTCRDVEQLVSFICNPDILCPEELLIIFLLLSPVETEKDPVFETYKCFYKNTSERNIITLCESKSIFSKWKQLIDEKCDTDIDEFSVNELSLSEINGTIMALGPVHQSNVKLLPSSDSSLIVLKQKDEDLMTALDVLCANQCEKIHDESTEEFRQFKLKQEEEFYRGGKVNWWNFYFCDKDTEQRFIKRSKYQNVKKMIKTQFQNTSITCVLLTLYHHPGCGATTLVMHVMWDLRKEFRCAVLKDNKVSKEEVAQQILKLMKLEKEKPCGVLLFVDDSKETETDLVNYIQKIIFHNMDTTHAYKVIILNCVRSHCPKEEYKNHSSTHCQHLTSSLTEEEKNDFENKLKELEKTHIKPENFYSFMFMKSNFDCSYTRNLASNTLKSFDISTKEAKLFAFLALLNTYVAESEISFSLCEDFLGLKTILLPSKDNMLKQMAPYSNLLIIERFEDLGGYKGVRILHNKIAAACLKEMETKYRLMVSDIMTEILHCDLFYSSGVVKDRLMEFLKQMLIDRQRNKDGKREQFSPLVEQIHEQQGREIVEKILEKASSRFQSNPYIPQALARYLYIKVQDFPRALRWAQTAKKINENPYTLDTIAQVYKSQLEFNMDREEKNKSHNPKDLAANLKIAVNAISAFERSQELARTYDTEEEPENDQDFPRKSYTIYGYVGVVEITFLVFKILSKLPCFQRNDPMDKAYLKSFLEKGTLNPSMTNEISDQHREIICENEYFLQNLKQSVKEKFEILDYFFTYLKPNNNEFDSKNRKTVREHFEKYVELFCLEQEQMEREQHSNPQLALKMVFGQKRLFLESKNAHTFSGILQHLETPAEEMEEITQAYAYMFENRQLTGKVDATKVTTNYILSNIVLFLSKPKSKHVQSYNYLCDLLKKNLQDVGLYSKYPDLYYTALLLFWPSPSDKTTDFQKYVTAIRNSSRTLLSAFFKSRSTVTHLFLAKGSGLKRIVSKSQLDKNFKMSRNDLAQLWRSGDIFKKSPIKNQLLRVTGTIEENEVYAKFGQHKVQVRPALIGSTRSGFSFEKVSFFLGFAINGPLAYDIQNES